MLNLTTCTKRTAFQCALTLCAAWSPRSASAQSAVAPAQTATGTIRGVVFDSLLMKPLAKVDVTILTTGITVTTDDKGRFVFERVPVGSQQVALSSMELDSLGLGTLGMVVTVIGGQVATTTVSTPSIRTLWLFRCSGASFPGADSSIVWGTIRDAATNAPISGATTVTSWIDVRRALATRFREAETKKEVLSDNSGVYFACGLPATAELSTAAVAAKAASSGVEYTVGPRRLYRLDLSVSTDMVVPDSVVLRTPADSLQAQRAHGRSTVRGIVVDDRKRPLANALVRIAIADTSVRTDKDGKFQLGGLPAGTQVFSVRRVGLAPSTQIVQLRENGAVDVVFPLSSVNTLATMRVHAKGDQRFEYEDRRERKHGYAVDSTTLNHRIDVASALQNLPLTRVVRSDTGTTVVVRNLSTRAACVPTVYLDGLVSSMRIVSDRPPSYFHAIEVLPAEVVPIKYMISPSCGVVMFWSKNARWK